MHDWEVIRSLARSGVPKAQIARDLGLARNTVARAVGADSPPRYQRCGRGSCFDAYEARVRSLLQETPRMPATVIAERIGWPWSGRLLRHHVALIRPEFLPIDPADRLEWDIGDAIQCDLWFPPYKVPLDDGQECLVPVLVMACAYSRYTVCVVIPTRTTADLLQGMWEGVQRFGGVPHRFIWDNESGIGRGNHLAAGVSGFMGVLGATLKQLPPRDPESKGIIERFNRYAETSFMPGRQFLSPQDLQAQLDDWIVKANGRTHATLHAIPAEMYQEELAHFASLPPVKPQCGWFKEVRLGRDYYVSLDGNHYSVSPECIAALVQVRADLDTVIVTCKGSLVAKHRRAWDSGITIKDPAHVAKARQLREKLRMIEHNPKPVLTAQTTLEEYDRVFKIGA